MAEGAKINSDKKTILINLISKSQNILKLKSISNEAQFTPIYPQTTPVQV